MKNFFRTFLFAAALFSGAARAATIYDTAGATDDLSTLKAVVDAVDGAEAILSDVESTLTVFAPTNSAFEALAAALEVEVADLLSLATLGNVLQYHVLDSEVPSSAVTDGLEAETVFGQTLMFSVADGTVKINDAATVTAVDIDCDGGVVHLIDAVLLPANLVEVAAATDGFSSLVAAVTAAGLADTLSAPGTPFTVFAPTDEAFTKALGDLGVSFDDLAAETDILSAILTYHVVSGDVRAEDLSDGMEVATVQGEKFTVGIMGGDVELVGGTSAKVTATNVPALNGVIHVIDYVLVPQSIIDAMADGGSGSMGSGSHSDHSGSGDHEHGSDDDSEESPAVSLSFAAIFVLLAAALL